MDPEHWPEIRIRGSGSVPKYHGSATLEQIAVTVRIFAARLYFNHNTYCFIHLKIKQLILINVEHFSGPQRSKGGESGININCYCYSEKTGMKFAVTKIPLGPSSLRKPQLFREAQKLLNIYARALDVERFGSRFQICYEQQASFG